MIRMAALYQTATKSAPSFLQARVYAAAPTAPESNPAVAPATTRRVGARLRSTPRIPAKAGNDTIKIAPTQAGTDIPELPVTGSPDVSVDEPSASKSKAGSGAMSGSFARSGCPARRAKK